MCPDARGNSALDRFGCPDTDGDGYSDPDSFWTASLWDSIGIGPDEFTLTLLNGGIWTGWLWR